MTESLYFDDLGEGDVFESGERAVTPEDIVAFCELSGDHNPIHTDVAHARASGFRDVVVPGLLAMSMLTGQIHSLEHFRETTVALLGIESWRFHHPLFAGDTLRIRITITSLRRTSAGTRGIVGRHIEVLSGDGVVVQSGDMPFMLKARQPTQAASS